MDEKTNLIRKFEISLIGVVDTDEIKAVSNVLLDTLKEYNVIKASNELVVYEDENEKILITYASCMMIAGRAKKSVMAYVAEIRKLIKFCNKNIKDITTIDVKGYLANMLVRGVSKVSTNNSKNYISSFYKWAFDEGFIVSNPCASIKAIKYEKIIKPAFTDIEVDLIRGADMSLRDRAIIEVLLSSGVRVNELCNLDRNDVDLNTLKLKVRNGKGSKDRITYISRLASYHLKEYLDSRDDLLEALFVTNDNKQVIYRNRITVDGIRFTLKTLSKRSGVSDIHPHKFRHTFATSLYNRGMDLHEIQLLLGHNDVSTTLRYISNDDSRLGNSYIKHMA